MTQRIAIARLFQETNALSPVPTPASSFERFQHEGAELLERCSRRRVEVPGIWRNAELTGFCHEVRRAVPDAEVVLSGAREIELMEAERLQTGHFTD